MAREGITKAQVFAAADAISESGQAPTVAGVRTKLGTGSFTTITAFLREWKAQAQKNDADKDTEVPEDVTEALNRAAALVWKAARDHFEEELAAIRRDAEQRINDARQELQTALDEIERLEANADITEEMQAEIDSHLAALRDLKTQNAAQAAELKACHNQIKEQSALLLALAGERKQGSAKATPKKKATPSQTPVIDDKTKPLAL